MTSIATTGTRGRVPAAEAHPCFRHPLISGYLSWKTASVAVPKNPSACTGVICSPELRQHFSVCLCLAVPLRLGSRYKGRGFTLLAGVPGTCSVCGEGPRRARVCNVDSGPSGRSVWPLRRTPRCISAAVKATSATSASPTCRSLGAQKVRSPWEEGSKWGALEPVGSCCRTYWSVGVGGPCDTGLRVSPQSRTSHPRQPPPCSRYWPTRCCPLGASPSLSCWPSGCIGIASLPTATWTSMR